MAKRSRTPREPQRGRTVPLPQWWIDRVDARLVELGWQQKQLAEELGVGPDRISKVLSNHTPTLELVESISDRLKIARPVVVAGNEAEALAIEGARRLFRSDVEEREINSGVDSSISVGQTRQVQPEHESRQGRRGKPR